MKQTIRTLTLSLAFTTSLQLHAAVSLKDASYSIEWTDLDLGSDLQIRRLYKSRSRIDGIFGFGWCSEIETQLHLRSDGSIDITNCDDGETRFIPSKGSLISQSRPQEHLYQEKSRWIRKSLDGAKQEFDQLGRLILERTSAGYSKIYIYSPDGLLKEIRGSGGTFSFTFDPKLQKVKRIKSGSNIVTYAYEGKNLVSVRDANARTQFFKYDKLHNLIQYKSPDGRTERIDYNEEKDQVVRSTDADGCVTAYAYHILAEKRQRGHAAEAVTECEGQKPIRAKSEYWFESRLGGGSYLAREKSERDGQITETIFDAESGQPAKITNTRGQTFHYSYDSEGRVTAVFEGKTESLRLIYNKGTRSPAEVQRPGTGSIRIDYDADGKVRGVQRLSGIGEIRDITTVMRNLLSLNEGQGS